MFYANQRGHALYQWTRPNGVQYWFGFARGLRKATQLLVGFNGHSHLCWPSLRAKWGAYTTDLDDVDNNYNQTQMAGVFDYRFMKPAVPRRLVLDLCFFYHFGDVVALPVR